MKRARQQAYRERFEQGAYCATVTLTADLQQLLIDEGHLLEIDLDIEDWRIRKQRLDLALARFLYAKLVV